MIYDEILESICLSNTAHCIYSSSFGGVHVYGCIPWVGIWEGMFLGCMLFVGIWVGNGVRNK